MGFVHECLDRDAEVALHADHLLKSEILASLAETFNKYRSGDKHLAGEGIAEAFDVGTLLETEQQVRHLV